MQLFEMQGLLAGKCLPGDMFVGESLSEYFLRQFNQRDELARQVSALQLSHDNIINSLDIKGDGPVSKLVLDNFLALAAEVDAYRQFVKDLGIVCTLNAPSSDHLLDYYRAQGVDELADHMELNGFTNEACGTREFAANLRAGRKG